MYSYWNGISEEKNVARHEFDITVAHTEPIVLTAEYDPIYRISRITGELDTKMCIRDSCTGQISKQYISRL